MARAIDWAQYAALKAQGLADRAIARELAIPWTTVRRHRAKIIIAGKLGAVAILLFFYAMIEFVQWRAVGGLAAALFGFIYLTWRELRPHCNYWRDQLSTPERIRSYRSQFRHRPRAWVFIHILALLGARNPWVGGIRAPAPGEAPGEWYRVLVFGAIVIGTLLQIIAVWP